MSAPNITLVNTDSMTSIHSHDDISISYTLFADDYYFENWTDWVDDSLNSPSNKMSQNAANYSNYVWKLKCTLAQENNACGFKHSSHGAIMIGANASGSISAVADTTTAESNTFTFTNSEYSTWKAGSTDLAAYSGDGFSAVNNDSEHDTFFQFFYCGGSRDFTFTCYKYQMASGEDSNPRFESG